MLLKRTLAVLLVNSAAAKGGEGGGGGGGGIFARRYTLGACVCTYTRTRGDIGWWRVDARL